MTLSRYGLKEWVLVTIICVGLGGLFAWLAWWWAIGVVVLIWIAGAGFFRDPIRRVPVDLPEGTMLSPADGTISKVFKVDHHEATDGPAQVVRIFLSVLDVHINRSPFDGEVVSVKHTPGKYHDARTELSAKENESNLITFTIKGDELIGVRQVSGAIARRIVCPLQAGDTLKRGEKFGMIKFGSTTELILPRPEDVEVLVAEGDKVKGGVTVLARLRPMDSTSEGEAT
ncbi:MAG: phosphatidylserine decarboxylase [Planctomycetota bacterium]|nr:phosphatidylserine decarboxylase [Planctomycetota bacterium]